MKWWLLVTLVFCVALTGDCRRRYRKPRQPREAAPVIVTRPRPQTGSSRGTLALVCNATGSPRPRIEWKKGDEKVSRNRYDTYTQEYSGGMMSVLWITNARKKKDAARFSCEASNQLGNQQAGAQVMFKDEHERPSGFPRISLQPTPKTVERTRPVSMECSALGTPMPTVRWYKNYLPLSINGSRITIEPSGTLNILKSNDSDQGKYHCAAENHYGVVFSEGANIYVRVRRVPIRFSISPEKKYDVQQNGDLDITCVAVGSPMPVVKWKKQTPDGPVDVYPLDTSARVIGRLVLPLRNVQESASYTCVATSVINTINFTTEVRVKALPKPPVHLRASDIGRSSNSLGIAWDSGDTEPVNSYTVYYRRRADVDSAYDALSDISSTSFTIPGLDAYVDYELRVSAINPQGEGKKSDALFLTTLEAVPGTSPVDINAFLYGISTVMVMWQEPVQPNGVISQYKLYYTSEATLPVQDWESQTASGESRLLSLRDLIPSVTYSIRASATNSAGEGPLSEPVMVKTEQGVPPQPRNFRGFAESSSDIHLSWDQPNWGSSGAGHDIVSYTIIYNCSASMCGKPTQITFQPDQEFTLTNLHPNTLYQIKLVGQTRFGKGAYTPTISVTTLADVPSAPPQNVAANPADESSIIVQWNPPPKESRNGKMTGYTIYYKPRQASTSPLTVHAETDQNSARIGDLKAFTTYDVWITSSTPVGEGPSSSILSVTTAESIPGGAPPEVSLATINSTAIEVRWTPLPASLRNGNIRGYQIVYAVSPNGRSSIINLDEADLGEGQMLVYLIGKLKPKTRYSVSVAAFTVKGAGSLSEVQYASTKGEVPSRPSLFTTKTSSGEPLVTWNPPQRANGELLGYILKYRCENCAESDTTTPSKWETRRFDQATSRFTPTVSDKIIPGWSYTFKLSASNKEGSSQEDIARLSLPPSLPADAPKNLRGETVASLTAKPSAESAANLAIQLSWSPLPKSASNGPITGYTLYYRPSTLTYVDYEQISTSAPSYYFANVRLAEKYEFQVAAVNSVGEGPRSSAYIFTVTHIDRPVSLNLTISEFNTIESSSETVWLAWMPPNDDAQYRYLIKYKATNDAEVRTTDVTSNHATISGLQPDTQYNFTVTTYRNFGDFPIQLGSSWKLVRTSPALITTAPVMKNLSTNNILPVLIAPAKQPDAVEKYLLVVVPWVIESGNTVPNSYSHQELMKNSASMRRRKRREVLLTLPYITAEFQSIDLQRWFEVGDGLKYGIYTNRFLKSGTSYRLFLRAIRNAEGLSFTSSPFSEIVRIPDSESSDSSVDPTPTPTEGGFDQLWIILVVIGGIVFIGVILTVVYCRKKRAKKPKLEAKYSVPLLAKQPTSKPITDHDPLELRRQNSQNPGMISHPPIPVTEMATHCERLRANDNLKFSQEYESIDPGQKFMWVHSTSEVNKPKNRYANVIAYDHSRLTLSPIDGVPNSDYINANYISGYRRQNAYIATQGPLRDTIPDFWRMVWEQRSSIIVMMTKCEEKSKEKCSQYWPIEGTEVYGNVTVTLLDEIELATYCIRTLALSKSGTSDRREIKHFQFTAWPDHGVPEHPTPVLNFMRRVKSHCVPEAGPLVVHCSAGVGRAGCFICIDCMLDRMKNEDTVDIYGQVTCMRAERNYMVQTEDQYIFIHDAILEAINCGNTELPARNLYNHLHKLTTLDPGSSVTGMELEFKRLAGSKAPSSRFVSANLPCNKFKNRLVNILPYEGTRVCLQPVRGVEGSDYINASHIDGYRQKQAYIATQGPLPETVDDFWRMLWEYNSTIVVMLTQLRENGRDKCHQYWPAERSARYQYFVVDPMAEYSMQQYVLREFKMTDARDGQSRIIRQFQFTDWPEQAVPKSGEGFIDFIGQVHKTKEQFGQEGPITIHCSAGVGRSGVFITLSIALERMRFENLVDMFQTVKTLRTQRPAMVQTEDQYQFCYRAALEYLGSFDHYATE